MAVLLIPWRGMTSWLARHPEGGAILCCPQGSSPITASVRVQWMRLGTPEADKAFDFDILSLRVSVGLLGERDASGWWTSAFLSATSSAFLAPVFGSNILQARYQGVLEAARRVHDERLGIGGVFHPFRLPETLEHRLFDAIQRAKSEFGEAISSPDAARRALDGLAGGATEARSGPALLGASEILDRRDWIGDEPHSTLPRLAPSSNASPTFDGLETDPTEIHNAASSRAWPCAGDAEAALGLGAGDDRAGPLESCLGVRRIPNHGRSAPAQPNH